MPKDHIKASVAAPIKPLRVKPRMAAKMIGSIGYQGILDLIHRGAFTVFDNGKRGTQRRIQLLTEEVELYAREGEDALREHRAKKKKKRTH